MTDDCFKDFLLSRMLAVRGTAEAAAEDDDWHWEAVLEVGPHPDLSETQAKVIALDYGMQDGKAKIKVAARCFTTRSSALGWTRIHPLGSHRISRLCC